jgi:RNA polymerase sigma factor (sigma-70 family)
MKVALNLVRSGFRRLRVERAARQRLLSMDTVSPELSATSVDLSRALGALPRRQREATVLRYYLDMDVREVARVLGIHEGTAKTTLFRARQALAAALGDEDDLEEANDRAGG